MTSHDKSHKAGAAAISAESYRGLMRHQAGAVAVIASGAEGRRAGLTATAVSSLSDEPPTILACIRQTSGAHGLIAAERAFSVNLLASGQRHVADCFAGRSGLSGEARFAEHGWDLLVTGAPVLVGALASLDCELVEAHAFSTHSIFIGRVVAGRFDEDAVPLLYFRNDYWDLGSG